MTDAATDLVSIVCTRAEALLIERYLVGLGGKLARFEQEPGQWTMYSVQGLPASATAPRRGRGK